MAIVVFSLVCALLFAPATALASPVADSLTDGDWLVPVTLEGGSGRASVTSPAQVSVEGGSLTATIEWSSPNYDYMLVDGQQYLPVNTDGNSVFQIPVSALDEGIPVVADTTAMSRPHEIEYVLTFDSAGAQPAEAQEAGMALSTAAPLAAIAAAALAVVLARRLKQA